MQFFYQEFPVFYAIRQHENTQYGIPINTANVDPEDIINEVDGTNLEEELHYFQYFLSESELERARHKVLNYAIENFNAKIMNEKIDHFLNNSKFAAKGNRGFEGFRWFFAHENKILLDRSKFVCNKDDLAKLKEILVKNDVIESCSRERLNTKWKFHNLTN